MKVQIGKSELELVEGDITEQETEAIVNAANKRLAPGGGVAGAIHRSAGPELWEECKELGGCETGEAKISRGYNLPASFVIHTVGPVYSGSSEDAELLKACYRNSLDLAKDRGIKSISFPALSTGAFGYPMKEAAELALKSVMKYLREDTNIELVRFVLYNSEALKVHGETLDEILELEKE